MAFLCSMSAGLFQLVVVLVLMPNASFCQARCKPQSRGHRRTALLAQYVCWVELVVISVLTPNASFLGHLAGILAGLAHTRLLDRAATQVPV